MFTTVCTSVDRLNPSIVFKVSIVFRSTVDRHRGECRSFEQSVDRLWIVQKNIDRFVYRSKRVSIVSSIAEKVSNVSSENVAKMTGYCNPSVWQNLVGIR